MKHTQFLRLTVLACVLITGATGCATGTGPNGKVASDSNQDPIESVNRVVFDVNDFFDRLLFKPLAELYRFFTPTFFRERVSNIFSDMGEPVVAANSLMQGRFNDAGVSLGRLVVNSTLGIGGMFDVAGPGLDWNAKSADFGQTLHTWGVGQGPYIVLPLLGPSTLRDVAGNGVDMVMSPWTYVAQVGPHSTSSTFSAVEFGVGGLVKREKHLDELEKLKQGSIDFYAQMRSVYLQYRNKQLGIKAALPTVDSYDEEK